MGEATPSWVHLCAHLITLSVTHNFLILYNCPNSGAFLLGKQTSSQLPLSDRNGNPSDLYNRDLNTSQLVHLVLNQINHDGFHHWETLPMLDSPDSVSVTHVAAPGDSSTVTLIAMGFVTCALGFLLLFCWPLYHGLWDLRSPDQGIKLGPRL